MEAQYLAIDGSIVTIEAEAELGDQVTRTGWAVVPSLMQGHPFTSYPAGHSQVMERAVRENFPDVDVEAEEEFSLKGGTLRVGVVRMPGNGSRPPLTVGAWEGRGGCLTTSLSGAKRDRLVEVFDTLQFTSGNRGLSIDSPVLSRPRPPEVVQEIPNIGVLSVRPAVASEMERIPRARGRITDHGELFRVRSDRNVLLLLGKACMARIQPRADTDLDRLSEVVEGMRVEWAPRATLRPAR